MPNPSHIKKNRSLKFLGAHLFDPNLWHLNRRSVATAFFTGIFCALLPMPFQMLLAAVLALWFRCNLPISVALVWITNPLTMPVIFYFTYKIGCYILQTPVSLQDFEASLDWLTSELARIWLPLYLGSIITGLVTGSLSYVCIRLFWRWQIITHWRERRKKRALYNNDHAL